jgi:hypothetical protein
MGKRRQQVRQQREAAVAATTKRDRMARVQVDDATWADFRVLAGYRPVSEVLGEMVTREVERYRSRRGGCGKASWTIGRSSRRSSGRASSRQISWRSSSDSSGPKRPRGGSKSLQNDRFGTREWYPRPKIVAGARTGPKKKPA